MSSATVAVVLFLLPTIASSLKCHITNNGNLSNPVPIGEPVECAQGTLSCIKMTDFTMKTYSKQCNMLNCTGINGTPNQPAQCTNTSSFGRETSTCCCYGDGCNSAPTSFPFTSLAMSVVVVFGMAKFNTN